MNLTGAVHVRMKEVPMFTDIRIGQPVSFGPLTVFPLFCEGNRPVEYLLSDEAMEAGTVTVGEASQEGSVPELSVENKSAQRVLFLEGEQLVGAKQNRILNTSVLVPALARLTLPVSCVEAGRWRRSSAFFSHSKHSSPHRLRHGLKSSVHRSLVENQGHRSDQGQVWDDVRKQQETLGVTSGTSALSDTYEMYEQHLAEAQRALQYVPGACGLAVAVGPQVVTADLFDQPATCQKVWGRLLSGVVLDSLAAGQANDSPDPAQVNQFLVEARSAGWTQAQPVGEGEELRAEFNGKVGSVLLLGGALVHGSVVAGAG
jgi:hypothetical protein